MKIAVTTSLLDPFRSAYPLTREEALRKLCAGGVRCLDYNLAPEFLRAEAENSPLRGAGWRAWCERARALCAGYGASFIQTHCFTHNYFAPEAGALNALLPRAYEITALLGAKVTVMHPIAPPGMEYDRAGTLHCNRDFFRRQAEEAARFGVRIAVENMLSNRLFNGGEFKRCCTGSEELMELVAAIDCENVGVCVDVGHMHYMGEEVGAGLRRCAGRLIALHLHDNDGFNDEHLPPYCGGVDWETVYRALREMRYTGGAMLEINHFCERMPAIAQTEAIGYIARLADWMTRRIEGENA